MRRTGSMAMNQQDTSDEELRRRYIGQLREWCSQGGLTPFPLGLAQAIESFLARTAHEPLPEYAFGTQSGLGLERELFKRKDWEP